MDFAELYSQYETRVYNVCLRITGNPHDAADATQEAFIGVLRRLREDGEPVQNVPAYLFAAARNASLKVAAKREAAAEAEEVPARDLATDPERAALLAGQQQAVREANASLPSRQREVLALRELGELSYDEIGSAMDLKANAVAQLVWRARIGLRDALRASAVASVVAMSPDCERALPLIAAVDDGEAVDPADRAWLHTHLAGCDRCKLGQEALVEAGASYRAWLPVVPAVALAPAVMAAASELTGGEVGAAAAASSPRPWVKRSAVLAGALAAVVAGVVALAEGPDQAPLPVDAPAAQAQSAADPAPPAASDPAPPPARPASSAVGYSSVDGAVLGVLASADSDGSGGAGGGGLPFSGLDLGLIAAAGAALLLAGAAMRQSLSRRPVVKSHCDQA